MTRFQRYAIYVMPEGGLARFGAGWLGWDALAGSAVDHPAVGGLPRPLSEITATPRKYGLHATIKPPFRLAEGANLAKLMDDLAALCERLEPVTLDGLALARLGGFLALVPEGPTDSLNAMAAKVVTSLDRHRAPPTEAELARRRAGGRLTPAQEANLAQWGYPYVQEEFRFHITLTGNLPREEAEAVATILTPHLSPLVPRPCMIDSLCLMGEDEAGMFHMIHRYPLGAAASRSNTATSA
jgi:putative phosphonate metabolism protein